MASQADCERCFEAYVVISTYIFRCSGWRHCFNVAAWKLCWKKKRFCRGLLANTARFLRISSLQTLRILAPEGIAQFGIALAKHCTLVFFSFVLQIDWWKPYRRNTHSMWCKWLDITTFMCLRCNTTMVAIGRKVRFHHTLCLWETKVTIRLVNL